MYSTNKKSIALIAVVCLIFLSCKKDTLNANGSQITEVRTPGNFHHVHTSGGTPIFITYGSEYKVELKGSENLIRRFRTDVNAGVLDLGYKQVRLGRDDLRIYVTLPSLTEISLSGNAPIEIDGLFSYQALFKADISGSGNITLIGRMSSETTDLNISGSGSMHLKNLVSDYAKLNISGSGTITNTVIDRLKGVISGSGSIYYRGNPVVESSISGSGQIIKIAP